MTHRLVVLSALIGACFSLTACLEGSAPEDAPVMYLSSLEQDKFQPTQILDPGPPGDPKNNKQFQQLFDGVEKNAQALFDRPGVERQLDLIERAYISAGRYQDLMAMYTKHVDARGAKSAVAPRLAWALVKLGQDKRARELSASLVKQAPTNATYWFIYGAYWLRFANTSNEAAKKLIVGWEETLKLNPTFTGFDQINAAALKKEVAQQRARLNPNQPELDAIRTQLLGATPKPKQPTDPTTAPTENKVVETPPKTPEQPPTDPTKTNPTTPTKTPEQPPTEAQPKVVEAPKVVTPPKAEKPAFALFLTRTVLAKNGNERANAISYLQSATKTHLKGDLSKIIKTDRSISQANWLLYLQLRWSLEMDRNETARVFRAFANRKDLSDVSLVDAAHFAHKQLEDKGTTQQLTDRLKSKNPALYKQMRLDKLTKTAK